MIRRLASYLLAVLLAGGAASARAAGPGEPLPEGPGRDTVEGLCSACHSLMIVKQQGLSRHRWDRLLNWMVEKQGMPELDAESRDQVLDYLSEHYGPDSRN